MMKRTVGVLLAATLGMSALAGCSSPAAAPSGGADSGPIKIGLNFELSGDVQQYGQAEAAGAELAIEEINAAGGVKGKKIQLVKYDTKSDPAEATTLATKLATQDKVVAIIGPATSGGMRATSPVATKNKVPVVSGSATAEDVTVLKGVLQEYTFRTCFIDPQQGSGMAKYAATKLNAKSAVIIKDTSSDYAKGLAENFKKAFTEGGGQIVAEEAYVAKETDFNAILTSIKGKTFDVIYLPGYYNEAGLIIKQARALGLNQPVLGGDGFDSPTLKDLAGASALNNVYFTNHYSSLDKDPKVVAFIDAFKKKFGKEPDAFGAMGYDTAKFVVDAISRASELTGEAVAKAMKETKDFAGVTGTFSMDPATHNPQKTVVVISLKDGVQVSSEKA